MLSINEINLLKSQNIGLKEQNIQLQQKLSALMSVLHDFANRFDGIGELEEELVVRGEDELGERFGTEIVIWGDKLDKLEMLLRDFIEFVEEVE